MAVIKPKFTLTSNAASATTDPGPASIALNLSAAPADGKVTVTGVETFIYTTTTGQVKIFPHLNSEVYIYMKNQETTSGASQDIHVGTENSDMTADPTKMSFTLSAGDFAFFPWSGQKDLYAEGASAGDLLEVWIFKTS